MADQPLRIAMVGAGGLSSKRIYPNLAPAGAKLVGVCDLLKDKREEKCHLYGGNPYDDMATMLDTEKPDGVIICIGPEQHAALAPIAIDRGIPVYTEKPSAPSAADALAVARLAHDKGVLCTTAFKKRYSTSFNAAKEWLSKFSPEDYYSISADYCSAQYKNTSARYSFLLDFAIHNIDLISYLFGDVAKVACMAKGMDAYAVSLKFTNGAVGALNLNCGRSFQIPTEELEITVKGGNFMTISNSCEYRITENGEPCAWRRPPTFVSGGDSGNDTGHLAELVDFMAAIREERTTRSNAYESYKSLVLYDAIKLAAESGEVVNVAYESLTGAPV